MPWPAIVNFGIEDNPLIVTPFAGSASPGYDSPTPPLFNEFLLLNGTPMGLLNGGNFLLLNPI